MTFLMQPQKEGRVLYLLLTLAPAILVAKAIEWVGLPIGRPVLSLTVLALIGMFGYFLVLKKNHTIEVSDISILEKDWRGTNTMILPGTIQFWRKNLLNELLLLDRSGKTVLCVESNMSNRKLLELWLDSHHITQKDKE